MALPAIHRLDHLAAMVVLFAAINGSDPFRTDLSKAGTVTSGHDDEIDLMLAKMQELGVQALVRIGEGTQAMEWPELNSLLAYDIWEVVLILAVTGDPGGATPIRTRLNWLMADISIRLGQDERVGATVESARIARVDSPVYSPDERVGAVTVRLASRWSHVGGSTT